MTLLHGFSLAEGDINYDEVYVQAWQSVLDRCRKGLEPPDYTAALEVHGIEDFRTRLSSTIDPTIVDEKAQVFSLLLPALDHFQSFATTFVARLRRKLSFECVGALEKIKRILNAIGHKLHLLLGNAEVIGEDYKVQRDAVEINEAIVVLWLNIISLFRIQFRNVSSQLAWSAFDRYYEAASQTIGETVTRAADLAGLARIQQQQDQLLRFKKLLSLSETEDVKIDRPRHNLPFPQNPRFFGREDILNLLHDKLIPLRQPQSFESFLLHGPGGYGKTQIAFQFAFRHLTSFDVVLWVAAEDRLSIEQSFSKIACGVLRLSNVRMEEHSVNRILVLNWLQETRSSWLIVFDNVEDASVLAQYWPITDHGSVIATTRRKSLAFHLFKHELDIPVFTTEDGARMLLHLSQKTLPGEMCNDVLDAARVLSQKLGGHPLGISQMAAFADLRSLPIPRLLSMYEKQPKRMHQRPRGWQDGLGYNHAVDSVWTISFGSLDARARTLLGVLSFLSPDGIPYDFFHASPVHMESGCSFLQDEFETGEVIDVLVDLALVNTGIEMEAVYIHRLVQLEFLYFIDASSRQKIFDITTDLLYDRFPKKVGGVPFYDVWPTCQTYAPHVMALLSWARRDTADLPAPKPKLQLCYLLDNLIWYFKDSGMSDQFSAVVDMTLELYKEHGFDTQLPDAYHTSLAAAGLHAQDVGNNNRAMDLLKTTLNFRSNLYGQNSTNIRNSLTNLASVYASAGDLEMSLTLLKRVEEIAPATSLHHSQLNLRSRSVPVLISLGRSEDAEIHLKEGLSMSQALGDWSATQTFHMCYAWWHLKFGTIEDAEDQMNQAWRLLTENSKTTTSGKLSMACNYYRGCVALAAGRFTDAKDLLEVTIATIELVGSSTNYRAQATHTLSQVLRATGQIEQADLMLRNAQVHLSAVKGRHPHLDGSEDDHFQKIVKISRRCHIRMPKG